MTSTTCGAVTPVGTWQVAADGVGDGFGAGLVDGFGLGFVVGFDVGFVVMGRWDGLGFGFVVRVGRVVAGAVGVAVVDVGLVVEVVGAATCSSAPQPVAASTARTAPPAASAVRVRLTGRSAAGRGCSTARPNAAPGR